MFGTKTAHLLFLGIGVFAISTARFCWASEDEGQRQAREDSDNPIIVRNLLQTKPAYTIVRDGGWVYTQLNRILLPYEATLIPGIRVDHSFSMVRFDIPIQYHAGWASQDATLLALTGGESSFGALGFGPVFSLPTASRSAAGNGKWSSGPAGAITVRSIPGLRLSLLLEQFFSFAGTPGRPSVNELHAQPIIQKALPEAFYLFTDPIYLFRWEGGGTTLPVNLQLGRAFTRDLSASIGPEYIATGASQGNWTIRMAVNYLNW